jgi:hypothetical protein
MEDVRRQDLKLFYKELLAFNRILLAIVLYGVLWMLPLRRFAPEYYLYGGAIAVAVVWATTSWSESKRKRFRNKHFEALWRGCQDRLARFEEVLKRMRKDQIADLHEMPNTIRGVSASLYLALRRADLIAHEVESTERGLYNAPPTWSASPTDPQSKELYRVADKNIAEYRQQLGGVMAGVQRAEAQSAVFMTTLDTLRMKMLGYRLIGRSPEMPSDEFLEAITEAKQQLRAIDTALDELDLGPYPTMIAAIPPPPIPEAEQVRIQQGREESSRD